ncbi:MAG TPA: hypothetical protein VK886_12870 [Vicinamibacterales bacterium]|nr:hypothetical protein [Vicinamibacterales bacterium]
MTASDCRWEQDVLDAVAARRWPDRCDDALRAHVEQCGVCADVAAAARAFLDDDEAPAANVPPASIVWWRAQLRAREDAAVAAARPLHVAVGAAIGCVAALLGLVLIALAPAAAAQVRAVASSVAGADFAGAAAALSEALAHPAVKLTLGAWIILAPVALYLALSRE